MAQFAFIASNIGSAPPGPWTVAPAPVASFSLGAAPTVAPSPPIWRVDLPADLATAQSDVQAAETILAQHITTLNAAPARIATLLSADPAAQAFATRWPSPAEQALRDVLTYPSDAPLTAEHTTLLDQFQRVVAQVQATVSSLALVETRLGAQVVSRTSISWTGDLHHVSLPRLPLEQAHLHQRSLRLALGSRQALVQSFGIVVRGAALASRIASSPVGAALALPALWRWLEEVLHA